MSAYSLTRIRKAWGLAPLRPRTAHWAVPPSRVRIPAALPNTKKAPLLGLQFKLAEEEGFEPSLPGLRVKRFSRPPHSTTLPPLRMGCGALVFSDAVTQTSNRSYKEKAARYAPSQASSEYQMAERWGFEPQIRFWRIHDFQSCSFGQLGHLSAYLQLHRLCSGNKVYRTRFL